MALLHIEADFRDFCERHRLRSVDDFLALQGVIWGGHPGRHVLHGKLDGLSFFLKKEHQVSWRDRLTCACEGFGMVSRSTREAEFLRLLADAGVGCPQVIAWGEADGKAFVMVRGEEGQELRSHLQGATARQRRHSARMLGRELAHMHHAGFTHPDLLAKHVHIRPDGTFSFLDWQRSPRPHKLSRKQREQNLAVLDATLADNLACKNDRLALLYSYLRQLGVTRSEMKTALPDLASSVRRLSESLQGRRRIQELRQPALAAGQQNLIWLDGERLCVTRQFREEFEKLPVELSHRTVGPEEPLQRTNVVIGPNRSFRLVRRWTSRPWQWLWSVLRRRSLPAPAFEQAAALFRLERQGVPLPRLLALGQEFSRPWTSSSFLLTEPMPSALALEKLLTWTSLHRRRDLLRQMGDVLRRIHDAGYGLESLDDWAVVHPHSRSARVVLQSVEHLCRVRVRSRVSVDARLLKVMSYRRDLMRIGNTLNLSRTDMLRVFLGYVDVPRLTDDAHRQATDWFDWNAHAASESASGTPAGPASTNDETVAWQASSDLSRHKRGRVTA